jgi:hypothetical protein
VTVVCANFSICGILYHDRVVVGTGAVLCLPVPRTYLVVEIGDLETGTAIVELLPQISS